MKRFLIISIFALGVCLVSASCKFYSSKNDAEQKADSLEKQTQQAMDSAYEENLKKMNAVPDSIIINDAEAPTRQSN